MSDKHEAAAAESITRPVGFLVDVTLSEERSTKQPIGESDPLRLKTRIT